MTPAQSALSVTIERELLMGRGIRKKRLLDGLALAYVDRSISSGLLTVSRKDGRWPGDKELELIKREFADAKERRVGRKFDFGWKELTREQVGDSRIVQYTVFWSVQERLI